ncbi:MAG: ATP-binding cassette domain-containing protein [Phycisphaerae bacterium]|nr:ATP-binding cassette domain-containing protein [Phycisphaerae bacterium]
MRLVRIDSITILGGCTKVGEKEPVERVTLNMGDVVSIVGPTGCGKTTLINDIELFANRNTPSRRSVLINGSLPPEEIAWDPSKNPIALISQHTNFLSDLPVDRFLRTHAAIRGVEHPEAVVQETVDFANQLTGEPLILSNPMTELSGGQTRALLIADAVIIGNAPIILLDEIENAGIHRTKALELLRAYRKVFIFVTHDPRIALLSDYRIVMRQGGMRKVILTAEEERLVAEEIKTLDDLLLYLRHKIREGEQLTASVVGERLQAMGYRPAA